MKPLDGKVAFITGGGSGIGRGIADRLARDGADVFIADVDTEGANQTVNLVSQLGRRARTFKANVAAPAQMARAVETCVTDLGRLDIAVANAGIGRGGPVLELSLKDWQDQLDVNLTGVFLTVQATARAMVRLGHGGRIVCISSLAAENTGPGIWAYSATKAGVRIMVRGWAQELGPAGITVNAIGPGVIDTPLAEGLAGEADGVIRKSLERRTPVGRVGSPSDIAGLVSFMAGPDGGFMTGSYVVMDGGLRDARAGWEPDPDAVAEGERIAARAQLRRDAMQTLLDERD
jgi:NAD(P)-dependent dehydrogenase (short-subunit alcohol dehydrogenase family)